MNFAAILVVAELDDYIGRGFIKLIANYDEILMIKMKHRDILEVHSKLIATFFFFTMYGSMLYSYFYDETHIYFMYNHWKMIELISLTIGVSLMLPILIHKFIIKKRKHYKRWFVLFRPK